MSKLIVKIDPILWLYDILLCSFYVLGYATPSEKAMTPDSSPLAWKIPWMEEPGRLQSMGSLRVGHDWATSLSFFTFMHWRRNGNPLQCSCLEKPRDGGAWWAAVYGVAQSRTRLKWLSSSSLLRRRQWQPTLVLLPGESRGWWSLVGCSPWGC